MFLLSQGFLFLSLLIKSFSYIQFLGFVYNERERQVIADISARHVLQKKPCILLFRLPLCPAEKISYKSRRDYWYVFFFVLISFKY